MRQSKFTTDRETVNKKMVTLPGDTESQNGLCTVSEELYSVAAVTQCITSAQMTSQGMFAGDISTEQTTQEDTNDDVISTQQPTLPTATLQPTCRDGWERLDNSCYFFMPAVIDHYETYDEAKKICIEKSAHLVEIDSLKEHNTVINHLVHQMNIGDNALWVNVTDTNKPYTWTSEDNKNTEGKDCVSMTSMGFSYRDCTDKQTYICEGKSHYSNSQNQVARGSFVPATTKHDHRRIKYRA
ncbi:hypothetical protein ScPMuIL_017267 [Solemya velum]